MRQSPRCSGSTIVEVEPTAQTTLEVFFLGKRADEIAAGNIVITGGRIAVRRDRRCGSTAERDPTLDDCMEVTVNQPGDFSGLHARAGQADDHGRADAGPHGRFRPALCLRRRSASRPRVRTELDCQAPHVCPPPARAAPEINYLAKDYASFRQLILDRLALTMPDWAGDPRSRHRHHAGGTAGLRGRLAQLLPGRGGHRGLSGHGPAAHLGAPARAAGRLSPARGLQRPGLGGDHSRSRPMCAGSDRRLLRHGLCGRSRPGNPPAYRLRQSSRRQSHCFRTPAGRYDPDDHAAQGPQRDPLLLMGRLRLLPAR